MNARTGLTVRPTKPASDEVAGSITARRATVQRWLFRVGSPRLFSFRFLYLEPVVPAPRELAGGGLYGGVGARGVGARSVGRVRRRGGFGPTQERTPLLCSLLKSLRVSCFRIVCDLLYLSAYNIKNR